MNIINTKENLLSKLSSDELIKIIQIQQQNYKNMESIMNEQIQDMQYDIDKSTEKICWEQRKNQLIQDEYDEYLDAIHNSQARIYDCNSCELPYIVDKKRWSGGEFCRLCNQFYCNECQLHVHEIIDKYNLNPYYTCECYSSDCEFCNTYFCDDCVDNSLESNELLEIINSLDKQNSIMNENLFNQMESNSESDSDSE